MDAVKIIKSNDKKGMKTMEVKASESIKNGNQTSKIGSVNIFYFNILDRTNILHNKVRSNII